MSVQISSTQLSSNNTSRSTGRELAEFFENKNFTDIALSAKMLVSNDRALAIYSDTDQKIIRHVLRADALMRSMSAAEAFKNAFGKDRIQEIEEAIKRISSPTQYFSALSSVIFEEPVQISMEDAEILQRFGSAKDLLKDAPLPRALDIFLGDIPVDKIHALATNILFPRINQPQSNILIEMPFIPVDTQPLPLPQTNQSMEPIFPSSSLLIELPQEEPLSENDSLRFDIGHLLAQARKIKENKFLFCLYGNQEQELIELLLTSKTAFLELLRQRPELEDLTLNISCRSQYVSRLVELAKSFATNVHSLGQFTIEEQAVLRHLMKIFRDDSNFETSLQKVFANDSLNVVHTTIEKLLKLNSQRSDDQQIVANKTEVEELDMPVFPDELQNQAPTQPNSPNETQSSSILPNILGYLRNLTAPFFQQSPQPQSNAEVVPAPITAPIINASGPIAQKFPNTRAAIMHSQSLLFSTSHTHQEWVETLKIPMHEILPGQLYLGSFDALREASGNNPSGLTRILTVTDKREELPQNPQLKQMRIEVRDIPQAWNALIRKSSYETSHTYISPSDWFAKAFDFIDKGLLNNEKVLIHCSQGVSRSATILIAYLMNRFDVPYHRALFYVQHQRPIVNPNEGFKKGLGQYQKYLRISNQ